MKVLKNQYGMSLDDKYDRFANVYNREITKYRNALGHAVKSNSNEREVYIGEINNTPVEFNEELFRKMRASINEYQELLDTIRETLEII